MAFTVVVVLLGAPYNKLDDLMAVSMLLTVYTTPHTFTNKVCSSVPVQFAH